MNRKQLRKLILEEYKAVSELKQFALSRDGRKLKQEGSKIQKAGASISELANNQTGAMSETLRNISEFVEKLGYSMAGINELDEGTSTESTLPTVAELKKLIKSIKKLEG
tara:strand:+ start:280 stop:609 length:330 start_codon:yes stop_codon:yes gene_type:complete